MEVVYQIMRSTYVILHNIRSAHNVGSILRSADAAGVKKVFLCGVTPSPVDRFGRLRKDIAKVALGAENSVDWEHVEKTETVIQLLKKERISIIAIEQHPNALPFGEVRYPASVAFILGEETKGIPKNILNLCESIVEIPMKGKKESLNVSVAAGIILFRHFEELS